MDLFKKDTKKKAAPAKKAEKPAAAKKEVKDTRGKLEEVLRAPWMSEKALIGTEKGIYVFKVPESATKKQVADAVTKIYSVTPRKVRLVHLPAKVKNLRTRRGTGTRARRHKAYVYLKKGETITFA